MSQNIKLIEYDDYKNISGGLPNGFTETTESETMPNLTYAWNDTLKALHVNDSSSYVKGSLEMSLGFLNIGDVIEISVEVMNISGVKAKIAIDNIETGLQNLFILQSSSQNEFEVLGGKYIVKASGEHKTAFGLFTPDVGEYYIRNVKITFQPSSASQQHPINKSQLETMFEMFKQQLRGYNLLMPDLTGKEYLGEGWYNIFNRNDVDMDYQLDYNVYSGVFRENGEVYNTLIQITWFDIRVIDNDYDNYVLTYIPVNVFGRDTSINRFDFWGGSYGGWKLENSNFNNKYSSVITPVRDSSNYLRYTFRVGIYDNVMWKLQIEKGTTATPYTIPGQIPQYKIVGEE